MRSTKIIQTGVIMTIFAYALTGWAVYAESSGKGLYRLEVEKHPNVSIVKTFVRQEGDDLLIGGRVKRKSRTRTVPGGHIDLVLLGPGGVARKATSLYYPRIIPRKGARQSYFTVRLPGPAAAGGIIRVSYHDSTGPDRGESGPAGGDS